MAVNQDRAVPVALAALQDALQAVDLTKLEPLQGAQVLGSVAARWVIKVRALQDDIAGDLDYARRVAGDMPAE